MNERKMRSAQKLSETIRLRRRRHRHRCRRRLMMTSLAAIDLDHAKQNSGHEYRQIIDT